MLRMTGLPNEGFFASLRMTGNAQNDNIGNVQQHSVRGSRGQRGAKQPLAQPGVAFSS
jgi:hypothetical protein